MVKKLSAVFLFFLILSCSHSYDGMQANASSLTHEKGNTFHFYYDKKQLLDFLNISHEEYINSIKKGKTLAEIGKMQGIDEKRLMDYLSKEMETEMDRQYKNGELNQDTYNALKRNIKDFVKQDMYYSAKRAKNPNQT